MRSRVIDIDDLSDCLSKSSIDDEVYANDSEWIHPFYKKLESKQTSYLTIQKISKRKRDDSDQENLKKIENFMHSTFRNQTDCSKFRRFARNCLKLLEIA